ncbi:SMP-30/gluconolactonase/LRE family protein [Sphingomonas sp. R-74633]|uniref:SMP-30/gluconolactonase/LRE family protein n=1 Tax=Sphingomonas sp. R-74633 TaxID=2751188 RepID=UPI0015D32AF2|nr:SMP-30/gluconolactonase/LRE family protein [Sphingomonas sp. R-74633]NYT41929.1 SMP-30/gluconolactonase/LRE family protein [Sphingomonas sp. R-74633]
MTGRVATAVASSDTLGECATWSVREQALYWVDIRGPLLHRFDPASGAYHSWPLPELCGGIVPMADGVMLALRRDLASFDPRSGALTKWCEVEPEALGNRLNEMRCDRQGRVWVGSMRDYAMATTGSLYRVSASGQVEAALADITIPNSLGWSPDGRTMYFADTAQGSVHAYAYDPEHGVLGAMRVLIEEGALPGRPDGCAIDAEGHVWSTRVGAGLVVRVAPDGRISDQIELPASQPTSCALGGSDLRTLYITTARQKLEEAALRAQPEAGNLFAATVAVPGLAEPAFAPERAAARIA